MLKQLRSVLGTICRLTSLSLVLVMSPLPPALVFQAPDDLKSRIAEVDGRALRQVMRLVGIESEVRPITVVLEPEDSALGRTTPRWIAGFANTARRTVVLFPARSPSYPHDSLQDVLLHEIAHVLIDDAAGGEPVPRWFHEGLALAAERAWGLEDRTRLMVAITIERRPLSQLDAAFRGNESQITRAYALAGAMVHDLLRDHDPAVASRILSRVRAGEAFEVAVRGATGESLQEIERTFWRESWLYQVIPFVTSSVVLWTGVMLLAVYAKRARAKRRAELRRQWDALDVIAEQPDLPDPPDSPDSDRRDH